MNTRPRIKVFTTTQSYRYLWLKYVVGFDLTVHCARCLKGSYSKHFKGGRTHVADVELNEAPARYYYLCGVTDPFVWRDNLHLAFEYAPGETLTYEYCGTRVVIEDARRIFIERRESYELSPYGQRQEYNTCRNWRFAYQMTFPQVHDVE